jgi:uncharacterized protein YggE
MLRRVWPPNFTNVKNVTLRCPRDSGRRILVTGEAIRSGTPETVEIFATVIATGPNAMQPLQSAASRIHVIGQAALIAGVPPGDIQVTALGVQQVYSATQPLSGGVPAAAGASKSIPEPSPLAGYQAIHSIRSCFAI